MKLLWYSGKISDFHPAVPGSIPGGNFFKKSQIFLITRGFQKFWQKTWNQQLLFYYSMRRGSGVQCSGSKKDTKPAHKFSNSLDLHIEAKDTNVCTH